MLKKMILKNEFDIYHVKDYDSVFRVGNEVVSPAKYCAIGGVVGCMKD